jgi:hypothetical protein
MSGWNEDNFLEKAMPLLEKRVDAGVCPDAETLCAVADGVAPQAIRQTVSLHAAHCSACADLMRRLGDFSRISAAGTGQDWRQAEKRLDARMREFLGAGQPRSVWWRLGWVFVPVTLLAAMMIVWYPQKPAPTDSVAARIDAPPPTFPVPDKPAPGVADLSATTARTPAPPPPSLAPNNPTPERAENAAAAPPAAEQPETVMEPATISATPRFAPVITTAGGQTQQAEPSAAPPELPPPAQVRLDAGTRVWILLQSTSPETSGGFSFRGMVLLPVTQGASVLLDRETRVVGTGIVNQGRTTIRIAEFEWRGTRYRLRAGAVAAQAPGPGAGPAVEFNAGQVLETFLASPSIYEKLQGGAVPQG